MYIKWSVTLTSSAHADERAAVFDDNVLERLYSVQIQSFEYVPQEIVSCKRGHVPFQDAQQKHLPHL